MNDDATANESSNSPADADNGSPSRVPESEDSPPEDAGEDIVYKYRGGGGELLYEVVRPVSKSDSGSSNAYIRDADGKSGLNGAKKVPYRLSEFPSQFDSRPITYHECESDVDEVRGLGHLATTTPCSPTIPVTPDLVAPFAGLDVAIFPDNDWEGRSHAGDVARTLMDVAESVQIVQLEGREEGEGVSEWIEWKRDEGLSDEEIEAILAKAIEDAPELEGGSSLLRTGEFGTGGPFWYVDASSGKTKIDRLELAGFLAERGFMRLYDAADESQLVRVEDGIVSTVNQDRIRDHLVDYLDVEVPRGDDVKRVLMRADHEYVSDKVFKYLPRLENSFQEDVQGTSYTFYQNGFVEVTAEGYRLRPYSELDGLIWEESVKDRKFCDLGFEGKPDESEYAKFAWNAMGREEDRYLYLIANVGYVQYSYKDRAEAFVTVLTDEDASEHANGRTGKSLLARGLSYTCAFKRYEARGYNFNRFAYQDLETGTNVAYFDDAGKDFEDEKLFSVTTGGMQVEAKREARVTIPFEESPKFILSTNHPLKGVGDSYRDRFRPIEFSDHYNLDHRPVDDFGHRLFDDWDDEEWNRFDNTMMAFTQAYLRDGMPDYEPINIKHSQLVGRTCEKFAQWAPEFIEPDVKYYSLREDFEEACPSHEGIAPSKFGKWITEYAHVYKLKRSRRKVPRSESLPSGKRPRYDVFEK
ncbi:hypothetical protein [Salinibacter sp.]|uniref:hypothetical protein n=1 Tax=Salinibacter sp. TaxID=2065818 RepID=UPI0021E76145|nr:hypothetical protein [Salinibacter sp.]